MEASHSFGIAAELRGYATAAFHPTIPVSCGS
jgi:hypothetical protein